MVKVVTIGHSAITLGVCDGGYYTFPNNQHHHIDGEGLFHVWSSDTYVRSFVVANVAVGQWVKLRNMDISARGGFLNRGSINILPSYYPLIPTYVHQSTTALPTSAIESLHLCANQCLWHASQLWCSESIGCEEMHASIVDTTQHSPSSGIDSTSPSGSSLSPATPTENVITRVVGRDSIAFTTIQEVLNYPQVSAAY
jgi:hypothetical protein